MASEISQMSDSSIVIIQGTVGLYTVATRCHTFFAVTLKYTEDSSLTILRHSLVVQSLPGWCCVVLFHKYPFKAKSKARNGTWLYLEQYSIKVKRDFILWSSRRNEHLYQLHYLSKNGNAFWRCVRDQPIRVQVTCCLFLYVLKTMR